MKSNYLQIFFSILFIGFFSESYCQTITINNSTSEAIINKSTVQVSSIETGEPFNYSIDFQNLNQSKTLMITDVLPNGLC
ncbi:hypothetical protein [Aestuariibaculum sediminum]|uniref:DUF11 domain-containing protein n=1 Tax=Aestuariibaculum sediminum TaxID=2770637 RepID=A0A8J6UCJ6_9FLAO|nr:hypothetical protein [Aestuariibaculum sediminum]MBD0832424.1 hypothetical protein [Aestuariibaculum sediminum]